MFVDLLMDVDVDADGDDDDTIDIMLDGSFSVCVW